MLSALRPPLLPRESLLKRRGLGPDGDSEAAEALSRDEPGLAAIYSASIRGRIGLGLRAGNRVLTLGDQVDGDSLDSLQSPRCATVSVLFLAVIAL